MYKLTSGDLTTALHYFEIALEKDPDYPLAHVGIALVWIGRRQMGITLSGEASPKVREAVRRALELDDTLAEAHYALALNEAWGEWNWEAAGKAFKRAIELNPNYADVRAYYSHYQMTMKRQDEAMGQIKLALELDPANELFKWLYAVVLLHGARRIDETIEFCSDFLKEVPNSPHAYASLVEAYYAKGMYEDAYEASKMNWTVRARPDAVKALELGYTEGGFKGAMYRLAEWKVANLLSRRRAVFNYVAAGKNQQALDCLERAFEERDSNLPYIFNHVYADKLRGEPRFQDLLRQMNFPEEVLAKYLNERR